MKIIYSIILSIWFFSCQTMTEKESLGKRYSDAIQDAEIAEPDEISNQLTAIKQGNKQLSWKKIGKDNYVKMVTWTSWEGYDSQTGKELINSRETWVTVFPELKNFCKDINSPPPELTLRLEQLLGLPPKGDKTRFIEFWVKPRDLFRPSPDPEIDDTVAELDFPNNATAQHKEWINQLKKNSYGPNGYPWTRLGYTYDWGNKKSKIGLSEFVIQKNAKVFVDSVSMTQLYCKDK